MSSQAATVGVPFNDTSRLFDAHHDALLNSLSSTAKSGCWLLGTNTSKFARDFSDYCGVEYCLPVANGTDALELALRAVLDPALAYHDQEVITVANAGGYTTSACRIIGATPVYADIEEETQLIEIASLLRCLGPLVKAIVITHLYGAAVNINNIEMALKEHGYAHIPIIEDCAQAHGARTGEQRMDRVGSLGKLATFSFYPTKNLGALGDAGAIVTSDPALYKKLQELHQYGWDKKYHVCTVHGRNSRMDELQAGILSQLLPHLDKYNLRRQAIWSRYARFSTDKKIKFLDYDDIDFVAHLAVLRVVKRDSFIAFMQSKGIAVDIHYPILDCDQPAWRNLPMHIDIESNLKNSRKSAREIVSIPCFPLMTEAEVDHVCLALEAWSSL